MSKLLNRAALCCRQSSLLLATPRQQLPTLLKPQSAHLSLRANPNAARSNNPNAGLKIAPSKRPLTRAPTPPPSKSPEELASLTYLVRRTPSIQLPVYRRWMSGGNRQVILIKKVDGDRRKMLDDLAVDLGVAKDDLRINPTTQHIEIKGDFYNQARDWLVQRGF